MSWKRLVGIILLVAGALASILGTSGLERDLSSAGNSTGLMPLEIGALLIGLVLMVAGGALLARSFLDP
jgi:hypothetical protein